MNEFEMVVEAVERLNICMTCEHLNSESASCNQCGCPIYFTARLMGERCPLGKWVAKDWQTGLELS